MGDKVQDRECISNLYHGEIDPSKEIPKSEEYNEIRKKLKELETNFLRDKEKKEIFLQYMENRAVKESIEAEHQFTEGFVLGVKLILEGLKN